MSDGYTASKPLKSIFVFCMALSVGVHLVSILLIACVWTTPAGNSGVNFLEMRDLVPELPVSRLNTRPENLQPKTSERPSSLHEPEIEKQSEAATSDPEPEAEPSRDAGNTPLGLGMTYGFVSSLGDGATLREDVRDYYLVLVERINKIWWERAATIAEPVRQEGVAVVAILNNGTLVGRQISRSTGSPEADRVLLESIDNAAPLPPLPASYGRDVFTAPLKITAPLQLFRTAK